MTDPLKRLLEEIAAGVTAKYVDTDYTDSYVAFMDVMGMKDLVSKPYAQLRTIFNAAQTGKAIYSRIRLADGPSFIGEDHMKMTIMSDSIVLSMGTDIVHALPKLIGFSSYLIRQLIDALDEPVFVRGGITRGLIFQDNNVVFGPGLVAAYQLEHDIAKAMRCVIATDVEKDEAMQAYLKEGGYALARDPDDGMYFIDFARPDNVDRLSAIATKVMASDVNVSLKKKYEWLTRYLDRYRRKRKGGG